MARFDVVRKWDWTSIPRDSDLRNEAPYVEVRSYRLNSNQILQAYRNYVEIIDVHQNAKQFYHDMYGAHGATTFEDYFHFPYFADGIRGFANNFTDTFQAGLAGQGAVGANIDQSLKKITSDIVTALPALGSLLEVFGVKGPAGINLGTPGIYVETPLFYQFEKNDSPIDVTFVLTNTLNPDSIQDNLDLIRHLTLINRPLRRNSIAVDPPRIYKVRIPGHRFIEWAFCSNFNVTMLGTRRMVGGTLVPEGYLISMQFQSLTLEHAGFMDETFRDAPTLPPFVGPPAPTIIDKGIQAGRDIGRRIINFTTNIDLNPFD